MDTPSWRAEIIDENAAKQRIIEKMAVKLDFCRRLFPGVVKRNGNLQRGVVVADSTRPVSDSTRSGP